MSWWSYGALYVRDPRDLRATYGHVCAQIVCILATQVNYVCLSRHAFIDPCTDRLTDGQDRQAGRQAGRQADRQTDRQRTGREIDREREIDK